MTAAALIIALGSGLMWAADSGEPQRNNITAPTLMDVKAPSTLGGSTVTLHVYAEDADALWRQAIEAGARVTMPLESQFWGERYGQLVDPFGHRWSISMQVKMSLEQIEAKRKAAMSAFQRGDHPN